MNRHGKMIISGMLYMILTLITTNLPAQEEKTVPQNYSSGIGIRFGTDIGLTYKHFFKSNFAWEGIASSGYYKSVNFTLLFEGHTSIAKTPGLNFFYGVGGHAGFFQRRIYVHYDPYYYYYAYNSYPSLGFDGIVGIEYKITKVPLSIGLDMKPVFDVYYPGYSFLEGALSVRYIFHGPG